MNFLNKIAPKLCSMLIIGQRSLAVCNFALHRKSLVSFAHVLSRCSTLQREKSLIFCSFCRQLFLFILITKFVMAALIGFAMMLSNCHSIKVCKTILISLVS